MDSTDNKSKNLPFKAYTNSMNYCMKGIINETSFPEFLKKLDDAGFFDLFVPDGVKLDIMESNGPKEFYENLLLSLSGEFYIKSESIFLKYAIEILEKSKIFKGCDELIFNRDIPANDPIWNRINKNNRVFVIYTDNKPHSYHCLNRNELTPSVYVFSTKDNHNLIDLHGKGVCYAINHDNIITHDSIECYFSNVKAKTYEFSYIYAENSFIESFDHSALSVENSLCKSYDYTNVCAVKSKVLAYDNSIVNAYDKSNVSLYDNSTGKIFKDSSCRTYDNSKALLHGNTACIASDTSIVFGRNNSTIISCDNSCAIATDLCRVMSQENVSTMDNSNLIIVTSKSNLIPSLNKDTNSRIVDLSQFKSQGKIIDYSSSLNNLYETIKFKPECSNELINMNWRPESAFSPLIEHNDLVRVTKESEKTLSKIIKDIVRKSLNI